LFIGILAIIVRSLRACHNVGAFVSRALASIPLVDYLIVFPLAPNLVILFSCPLLAITALGLQKIAPAT
ncbi:MAG TPA: hypothetical protein DDY45_09840, partial [Verrucomicrobiales bacterium]|nr:hypothetical protein [Verrucomicrobiales bacterium]